MSLHIGLPWFLPGQNILNVCFALCNKTRCEVKALGCAREEYQIIRLGRSWDHLSPTDIFKPHRGHQQSNELSPGTCHKWKVLLMPLDWMQGSYSAARGNTFAAAKGRVVGCLDQIHSCGGRLKKTNKTKLDPGMFFAETHQWFSGPTGAMCQVWVLPYIVETSLNPVIGSSRTGSWEHIPKL